MGEPDSKLEPQSQTSLVPLVEYSVLKEARVAIPGFASEGTTVVAGPEFIEKVSGAIGDGLGRNASDTRKVLLDIAYGKRSIEALDELTKRTDGQQSRGNLEEYLHAMAITQEFIEQSVRTEAKRRGVEIPALWFKTITVEGSFYTIMDLARHQKGFFEMLYDNEKDKNIEIPPYDRGVLDELYPQGGIYHCENSKHLKLGPFEKRLAAIVYTSRTRAFNDMLLVPNEIEIGVKTEEGYPGGRIYTIIKNKPMVVGSISEK